MTSQEEKMDSLVRDFMSKNKVLVSYVRDVYGFRKGVVVALGKDQLGFSLVHKRMDVDWKRVMPHQLPNVQRMMHFGEDAETIMNSEGYQKCLRNGGEIRVPKFDRKLGLMYAIDSAKRNEITFETAEDEDGLTSVIINGRVPNDPDLINVVFATRERAMKFFKDE
jgi:hypothetical protein